MVTTVTPTTTTPVHPRHLGRKVALGAAAVAFGVTGAFVIEAWTDSDAVTDTQPAVVEEVETRMLPITPDAAERWVEADSAAVEAEALPLTPDAIDQWVSAQRAELERYCTGLHSPDAIEGCLGSGG